MTITRWSKNGTRKAVVMGPFGGGASGPKHYEIELGRYGKRVSETRSKRVNTKSEADWVARVWLQTGKLAQTKS